MQITEAAKRQAALEALRVWHNAAIQFPENYSLTFTQLIDWVDKSAGGKWREFFGESVISAQEYLGFQAVNNAMENLATKAQGRADTYADGYFRGQDMYDVLIGKFSTYNWDRIKSVGVGVATDIMEKVESTSKLFLGGSATYLMVLGIIGLVVFANSAGKSVKVK